MKLVYSKKSHPESETIHRFTVLEDFGSGDREVLKKSLMLFLKKLEPNKTRSHVLVVDFSECMLRINENRFQEFISEIRTQAIALGVSIVIAQSDIESIHAESKAVEQALQNKLNLLENKLNLIETVKNKIELFRTENETLKAQLKEARQREAEKKKGARGIFEKLWSDS